MKSVAAVTMFAKWPTDAPPEPEPVLVYCHGEALLELIPKSVPGYCP